LIERKAPQILKLQDAQGEAADYNDYNNSSTRPVRDSKEPGVAERVVRDEALENHPVFGGAKITEAAKEDWSRVFGRNLKIPRKVMPRNSRPRHLMPKTNPSQHRLAGIIFRCWR